MDCHPLFPLSALFVSQRNSSQCSLPLRNLCGNRPQNQSIALPFYFPSTLSQLLSVVFVVREVFTLRIMPVPFLLFSPLPCSTFSTLCFEKKLGGTESCNVHMHSEMKRDASCFVSRSPMWLETRSTNEFVLSLSMALLYKSTGPHTASTHDVPPFHTQSQQKTHR